MMSKRKALQIDIIGAGNVAWHLAPALENAGAVVRQIYSRSTANAQKLANRLYEGEVKSDLDFSQSQADLLLLAVADNAIEQVCRELILPDHIVLAHTSGATPLQVLSYTAAPHIGVFYPLQTFTKMQPVNFKQVPLLIESHDATSAKLLAKVAGLLTSKVYKVATPQRKQVHVAAVFASNFTNWMLNRAQHLMQKVKLDNEMLHPLIVQSINNVLASGARNSLTGPARRNDLAVLDEHMQLLGDQPEMQELYRLVSQQIIDYYQVEE